MADELRVTAATVCKWRARFIRKGVDGLRDEPRPGVPRTISDSVVEHVVISLWRRLPKAPRTGVRVRWLAG